jgi:seryl-tRNA synthetase
VKIELKLKLKLKRKKTITMKEKFEHLKERLEHYHKELENGNYDVEQEVVDLESEIQDEITYCIDEKKGSKYHKLLKKIKSIKREYDFYDAERELDRMFPNRHDDDFDEDTMSYDSVFGDE